MSLILTLLIVTLSTKTKTAKHLINLCMNERPFFYKGLWNKLSTLKYWNGLRLAMESQFRSTWFRKGIDLVGMYLACYFGMIYNLDLFIIFAIFTQTIIFQPNDGELCRFLNASSCRMGYSISSFTRLFNEHIIIIQGALAPWVQQIKHQKSLRYVKTG